MSSLMRRAVLVGVCLLASASVASASMVIEVQAYIDGRDQLIIQGNTLQWHHLDWDAVGRTDGGDEPTIVSTWLDGVPVMNGYQWIPTWSAPPPDGIFNEEYSSLFEDLDPPLWAGDMIVTLDVLAGRETLQIVELPTVGNGYAVVVDFDDNVTPGADWYHARLTIVPEPATMGLLGLGIAVLAARRKRK